MQVKNTRVNTSHCLMCVSQNYYSKDRLQLKLLATHSLTAHSTIFNGEGYCELDSSDIIHHIVLNIKNISQSSL